MQSDPFSLDPFSPDPFSLDRLHDIIPPEPVSWWPPAPFWWCLVALIAVWATYGFGSVLRRWLGNAYRRAALRELEQIATDDKCGLTELSVLLKRVALVAFPREQVAPLSGDLWLQFLNETCDQVEFLKSPERQLGSASYDPRSSSVSDDDMNRIVRSVGQWIRSHRAESTA